MPIKDRIVYLQMMQEIIGKVEWEIGWDDEHEDDEHVKEIKKRACNDAIKAIERKVDEF